MASAAATVPDESDLLCEACGYTLNGLPEGANCPECGVPAADSARSRRGPPAWERAGGGFVGFWKSTADVLFRPRHFYRVLATRAGRGKSRVFAFVHMVLAAMLFGTAAYVHERDFVDFRAYKIVSAILAHPVPAIAVLMILCFVLLAVTTPIAARLTSWEARYRGYRLPLHAVRRGLDYHAAHYLPVAFVAAFTVIGNYWIYNHTQIAWASELTYLYVLCVEVVIGAIYLFWTYWIGMRNMLYANS